ncbi:MAG: 3-dehydroquinate dehydratase [Candidatus Ancillula sp.]|jgi:3-dehydroquinate dehydratase-2|nr:3-dehydroquinate dehydratase [Candidatus Ancillula sp.]
MQKILIMNGPNLNLLGTREPDIYGNATLTDLEERLRARWGATLEFWQSNSEADAVEAVHTVFQNAQGYSGIIINPGAWTHYSYALRDALSMLNGAGVRVVEVHISNPTAREEFRQKSVVSAVSTAVIAGCGLKGYELACEFLLN